MYFSRLREKSFHIDILKGVWKTTESNVYLSRTLDDSFGPTFSLRNRGRRISAKR